MSVYWLSLHVHGLLVSLEPVVRMLEGCRHRITRADERFVGPGWITPVHVLSVDLGRRERPGYSDPDERDAILAEERSTISAATALLQRFVPTLASLDRSTSRASLWLSTIRYEDQGGIVFPPEIVAAAAAGGLGLDVSIAVGFDSDDT